MSARTKTDSDPTEPAVAITGTDAPLPSFWQRHKKKLIVALALILVAAAAGYIKWDISQRAAADLVDYQTATLESQQLRSQKRYDAAIKPLQQYADQGHDNQRRAYALTIIANIYEVQNMYPQALSSYRRAEKLRSQPDYVITVGIARDSEQTGDTKTAAAYYDTTVKLLKALPAAERQSMQSDIVFYQSEADRLRAQP